MQHLIMMVPILQAMLVADAMTWVAIEEELFFLLFVTVRNIYTETSQEILPEIAEVLQNNIFLIKAKM